MRACHATRIGPCCWACLAVHSLHVSHSNGSSVPKQAKTASEPRPGKGTRSIEMDKLEDRQNQSHHFIKPSSGGSTAAMARATARHRPAGSPKWGDIVLALNGGPFMPLLRNWGVAWVGSSSLAPSLGPSAGVGGLVGPVGLEVPRYLVASLISAVQYGQELSPSIGHQLIDYYSVRKYGRRMAARAGTDSTYCALAEHST